jgi:hypothetical protein
LRALRWDISSAGHRQAPLPMKNGS